MLNDNKPDNLHISIEEWVERARLDPVSYMSRQATEVILTAISMSDLLSKNVFLKGGILMGVLYNSPRSTRDVDFSTTLPPSDDIKEKIKSSFDKTLPLASAELGYPDLHCKIQSMKVQPKKDSLRTGSYPALEITIGYARSNTRQKIRLDAGQATDVIPIDISFNEKINSTQIIHLGQDDATTIQAYSLCDIIAEKFRAILQQSLRNRSRRQDVYDINSLITRFPLDEYEINEIYSSFISKCRSRKIEPSIYSLCEKDIIRRSKKDWDTLSLEIGEESLPNFYKSYRNIISLYRSLPWQER